MADTTTTKVLEVVVDNNKAIASIASYNQLIDAQKAKQKELAESLKAGKISQTEYQQGMAKSKEEIKAYSRSIQELSKEVQNNIKMDKESEGSLRALRAELSNLTKAYDSLSREERMAAEGMELQSKIKAITGELKGAEQNTGRFFRNVGNYANGFMEAFQNMGGSVAGLKNPLAIAQKGLMAISTTPVIAILGAIVMVIQKVIQSLKSSEKSMHAMTVAMAPLNAAGRLMQKVMEKLGEGIVWVAEKLSEWADKLGLITDAMKEEQQLAKDNIALQLREREVSQQNADSQLKIAELKAKSADKLKYSAKERAAFLEQALAEEDAIAKRELEISQERYRILQQESQLAENSTEENEELARAYVEMRNAETSYFNKSRELTAQLTEARKQEAEKAVRIKKEQFQKELELARQVVDAELSLMKQNVIQLQASEKARHDRAIEDLNLQLNAANLTAKQKESINRLIELEEQRHQQNMETIRLEEEEAAHQAEIGWLDMEIELAAERSDELLKLKKERLEQERQLELVGIKEGSEAEELILRRYQKREEELVREHNNTLLQYSQDLIAKEWENKINAAANQGQQTLQLEVEAAKARLDALHQLEGESDADFKARQLAAEREYIDAKKNLADYELSIEQAKYDALANMLGGLSKVFEAFGEENEKLAKAGKILALGEIAVNTGKAIAAGVAQASATGPWPANLAAIATTVTTVLANIAAAVKSVKSAKFATGGLVTGPGSGTSDSIHARLSNGESVMNAKTTSMFGPLLSTLNQAGGGIAFNPGLGGQREGYDFLASAVAAGMERVNLHVGVDEITRVQDRVAKIKDISTI